MHPRTWVYLSFVGNNEAPSEDEGDVGDFGMMSST